MMTNMMRRSALLVVALVAVALSLGGCALLQGLAGNKRPELNFQEVRFTGWALDRVHFDLVYELDNPYEVPLELAQVSYELQVEGKTVVSGAPKKGLRIQPRKTQPLIFPATIHFLDAIPTVEALFRKDALDYRARGEVGVDTPLGVVAMPLSKSGAISVPRLPQVSLVGVSVPEKSLSGATVAVALDLKNENSFPVPLTQIDYALRLGGARVGSGKVAGKALQPGATTRIELPLGVSLVGAGQALLGLVSGNAADVSLQGNLGFGSVQAPISLEKRLSPSR